MNVIVAALGICVLFVIGIILVTCFVYDWDIDKALPCNVAFFIVMVLLCGSIIVINGFCKQEVIETEEFYGEYTYSVKDESVRWVSDGKSNKFYNVKFELTDGEGKVVKEKLKPEKIKWWPFFRTEIVVYIDQNDQDNILKIINDLIK